MKKKLSEKQQELVALLPEGLSKMPNGAKIVLGFIILRYGTDYAKKYGYIFRSNKQLMQDTGLTEPTVIASVRKLELLGLISTIRGKRDTDGSFASYYYLSDDMKEKINFSLCTKINGDNTKINTKINEGITKINVEGLFDKIKCLELKIKQLEEENTILKDEVILAKKKFYFSTDIDIEPELNIKSIPDNNASSIPAAKKTPILFEDTPLIEFINRAEECFEQLDDFFSTEKKIEILSALKEEAKGVARAKQVVEDLIVSYGEKLGWTETFKSQLLEKLFPNADA